MRPFFSGRIAVKVDALQGDAGSQFSSGAFELGGDEHNGQLRLLSPLGQVLAQANWAAAGEVALRTGQETRHFASLATMSRQLLGEDIPLAALVAWMAGRTWAGAPHQTLDTAQRFEQLGWTVDASALSGSGRLMAERLGPPAVVVRVRLDPAHLPALLAPP
jgi:outer membrane lipoprotein LolB